MDMLPAEVPSTMPRILLVEDDDAVRRSLQLLFRAKGYDVRAYPSAIGLSRDPEALRAVCLVADLMMPGKDALELLGDLRAANWQGHPILISGFLDEHSEARARKAGYERVFAKPVSDSALVRAVAEVIAKPDGHS